MNIFFSLLEFRASRLTIGMYTIGEEPAATPKHSGAVTPAMVNGNIVETDRLADRRRISIEPAQPIVVADHCHPRRVRLVVVFGKSTPGSWVDPKATEEVA